MMTLSKTVAEKLRREIFAGKYAAGERLPSERKLSEKLGVSRIALREALKKLEQNGFVEIRRGDGSRVKDFFSSGGLEILSGLSQNIPRELSRDVLKHALEFRISYAGGIAELAAKHATPVQQSQLKEKLGAMRDSENRTAWVESERAFMNALVDATGNMIFHFLQNSLARVLKTNVQFLAVIFRHRNEVEGVYRKIVDAAGKRDEGKAAQEMRRLMGKECRWIVHENGK